MIGQRTGRLGNPSWSRAIIKKLHEKVGKTNIYADRLLCRHWVVSEQMPSMPNDDANNHDHRGDRTQARKLPFRILLCGRTHYFPLDLSRYDSDSVFLGTHDFLRRNPRIDPVTFRISQPNTSRRSRKRPRKHRASMAQCSETFAQKTAKPPTERTPRQVFASESPLSDY